MTEVRVPPSGPFETIAAGGALLAAVWFVDLNTSVALADQTGAIGAPFATANQGFAAAQADATANVLRPQVIVFTSGDYSAEAVPPALDYPVTLTCWRDMCPNQGADAFPQPIGLAVLNGITSTADLIYQGVYFSGSAVTAANVTMRGAFTNQLTTCESFKAYAGSQFGDLVTTVNGADIDNCVLPASITVAVGQRCRIRNCTQTAACAVTGDLELDGYSNSFQTITATGLTLVDERQARETVSVVVPAVLAGSVGYVSTALVAELQFLPQFAPVVGNPQADLVAAGAGGGFVNCWADAVGSVRCSFVGPLAGGAVNFTFARV